MPLAQQLASRWASSLNDYFLNIYQGWIAAARGRPQDAITFYRHMPEIADAKGSQDLRCLGEVMVAEALLAIGDFKAAAAQIALWLVPLERSQAWFDFFAAAYVTAAYLSLRSDGLYAALAVLERMRILAVDRDAPSLLRLIPPLKLSLLLRAGTWKEARAWEAEQQIGIACHALPENPRASSWRERDLLLATMAEFYIRAKNLPEARACIQRLEDDALRHGRAGAVLTARSLRSSLIWGQGGRGQAIILLGEVLEEAVASGQRAARAGRGEDD